MGIWGSVHDSFTNWARRWLFLVSALFLGFVLSAILKPLVSDSATSTYYFTLDGPSVDLGADGYSDAAHKLGGKITMTAGTSNTPRYVKAAVTTTWQVMQSVYGPTYSSGRTLSAPVVTIGVRDYNGTSGRIYWKADIYDYDPAGTPGNGLLLWSSTGRDESHPHIPAPETLSFENPEVKDIPGGHRLKVVISCRMVNTNSAPRLYWGYGTNYSFVAVSEDAPVTNSVTVANLADYNAGALTTVLKGEEGVAMLKFDLYANTATTWTGGKLDKIGSNSNLGDVTYSIWKDSNKNGIIDAGSDQLVGGPYLFSQAAGSPYVLATPQNLSTIPQRYFVTYTISSSATAVTTVGARIANASYFTVSNGRAVNPFDATSSSLPVIAGGGAPVSKIYAADWDMGTTLLRPETGGPSQTNSICVTTSVTEPAGTNLVGLLNFPGHSCASIFNSYHVASESNSRFVTLYFNGPRGYPSVMTQVKGISFRFRAKGNSNPTYTVTLFYIRPDGTRVNSPISSKVTANSHTTVNVSLAGQTFLNVPAGSRLGVQIGVNRAGASVGLGAAVGAALTVEETGTEMDGVVIGDGLGVPDLPVFALSTGNVVNSFSLSAPAGSSTVSSVTITGNATTLSNSVASVKLYADRGIIGAFDSQDILLGTTTTFTDSSATIGGFTETVGATPKYFLVVYDITATPLVGANLTGLVTDITGSTSISVNEDMTSATLTVMPTTYVSNGTGEPASVILPSGGPATNLDAFGLKTNGGENDIINTVTATLAPAGISARVAQVEIVNRATGNVYGSLSAPTLGDDWRVSTGNLVATPAGVECYVRIRPKADLLATYAVTGTVTAVTHLQNLNGLELNDTGSATITLDGQPPSDPVLSASSGLNAGEIRLNWTAATDLSGLHPTAPYRLVRGAVNAPPPPDCASGTVAYEGVQLTVTDKGLLPGEKYSYRVCANDVVGNRSGGTTATASAQMTTNCSSAPTVSVTPRAQYIQAGGQIAYSVFVNNNDSGGCAPTTFSLSLGGTENSTDFVTPSAFSPTTLTVPANGGGGVSTLTVTARATAAQGAMDTFTVRATASGHPTAETPAVTTTVNDGGPMLHNSITVGTRYGTWGGNYGCSTCHAKDTPANIKRIAPTIATPTGIRPVSFVAVSAPVSVTSGVLGNDKRPDGRTSVNVCEVCHHKTIFHQYSAVKLANTGHRNGNDCIRCHSHGTGFKYSGGAQCDGCHGNPPTTIDDLAYPPTNALGPAAMNAGAHGSHQAIMGCDACHYQYTLDPMGNDILEIGFNISATTFPGFVGSVSSGAFTGTTLNSLYQWRTSPGTTFQQGSDISCNVYCHGWPGGGGSIPAPTWTGSSQSTCGTCHNATGLTPPTSGSHAKHSGTTGASNGIPCGTCHGTITTPGHVNGTVQWDLAAISPAAAYRGVNKGSTGARAPTDPVNFGSCSQIYCHSNVQGATNPALGTGGPSIFATPRWNDVATCGSCHVDMATSSAATGGHVQHAQLTDTAFDCRICHSNAGTTTPSRHANGTIELSFSGVAVNTVYSQGSSLPGNGYGSCSSSNCHGRQNIVWGPSIAAVPNLCDKCHGSTTSGLFYSTFGVGSTTSPTDPLVGAHTPHSISATYKYSSPIDCEGCHIRPAGPYSPGHIDTPVPAEIIFGQLASSGVFYGYTTNPAYSFASRQCTNVWCHGSGMYSITGKGPYASVTQDGGTLTLPGVPVWNQPYLNGSTSRDCTWCHGYPPPAPTPGYVHYGKGPADCNSCHNNVKLDGSGFIDASIHINGLVEGGCITCHGNPPIDLAGLCQPPINALSPGNAGAHNAHQLNPSIGADCGVCHANYTSQMPSYTMEMGFRAYGGKVVSGTYYGYSSLTNNVYISSSAGTVVRRTNDLALANRCVAVYCHGGGTSTKPPLGGGTISAPDWELGYAEVACGTCHGVAASSYATTGSHGRHAGAGSGGLSLGCDLCHGAKVNNYHVNGSVEWDLTLADPRFGTAARYANLSSGVTGNLAPSATFSSCSSIYCHSNVQGIGGSGPPTSYQTIPPWGNNGALSCSACHNDMAASGTGSHLKHKAYGCATCHSGAGDETAKHGDHYIDVTFSGQGSGSTYSQARTSAGSDGYGSCSNISCHYNGSATWGNTLTCSNCHPLASLLANGAHGRHLASAPSFYNFTANRSTASVYDFGCANCHPQDAAKHANGIIDVTINRTNTGAGGAVSRFRALGGATADGLAASNGPSGIYGTSRISVRCALSYCHSNGYAANQKYLVSPDWYGPAYTGDKCAMCHGNSPNANDPLNQPGSPAHYSKNFLGYANISGGHGRAIHMKGIFTGIVGLAAPGNTPVGSHGNPNTSTTINCNACHYATVTSSANDRNIMCVRCHGSIPKNPAELIANKRLHLSGSSEVAFNPIRMRSKAQLRTGSQDSLIWSRPGGYKIAGAYDVALKAFSTATQWNGTTKTCSNISCHNGKSVTWGATGGATKCLSCHDRL